jgi:hypothetical protein
MINIDKELVKKSSFCHFRYLKPKLEKRINDIIKEGSIKKNNNKIEINTNIKKCLNYININLKEILLADINKMNYFIQYFQANYSCITTNYSKKDKKPPIYEIIYNIFISNGYDSYFSRIEDSKQYDAYIFVKKLGIKTCPYCNRNYISIINKDENGNKQTRPEIDHFYPKSIYPFLACSFYNLIPSCKTCNHLKSDDDSYVDKLINPYNIKESDFKFSYLLNNIKILENNIFNNENIIKIIFDKKLDKNDEYFQLEKLYQEHKDIVLELLIKKQYYPQSYINELKNNFGFTQDEIYRYLFCNYKKDEDLHKRPLSKLIKDISEELKLI